MDETLGEQCLSCKRRRVKCDSAKPTCKRCRNDCLDCPGYDKWIRFKYFQASKAPMVAARGPVVQNSARRRQKPPRGSICNTLSVLDSETLATIDAIRCYNEYIVPALVPAHGPFDRDQYVSVYWEDMPRVLRHVLNLAVRTARVTRGDSNQAASCEVYHYRGLALAEITASLSRAVTDPYGILLGAILMLMMADLQLSFVEAPSYHMKAAHNVIAARGGFAMCFERLPGVRRLLISFMAYDTFGATTQHRSFLDPIETANQYDYISLASAYDEELVRNAMLCPPVVLRAIIHTTLLRLGSYHQGDQPASFEDVLQLITYFDAGAWAVGISTQGRPLPQPALDCQAQKYTVAGWTALAGSFQQATLLYLLMSSSSSLRHHCKALEPMICSAKEMLLQHLHWLFSIASADHDDPIQTQLYKYIAWPLVISTYVKIGWDVGRDSAQQEINRLKTTGRALGSRRLTDSAKLMQHLAAEKARSPADIWAWGDGFDSRQFCFA